jgi:hypothetical protein
MEKSCRLVAETRIMARHRVYARSMMCALVGMEKSVETAIETYKKELNPQAIIELSLAHRVTTFQLQQPLKYTLLSH